MIEPVKKILVYGDSILKGIQLKTDTQRYCVDNHIDVPSLERAFSLEIENDSRFGCTVTKGYALLERAIARGQRTDHVVMDFGGNDCDFDWAAVAAEPDAEHLPHTPLPLFTETYRKILKLLKDNGVGAFLTTLPPILAERYLDFITRNGLSRENILKWLGGTETIYRYQENYSRAVEALARETHTPLIDLRGAFLAERRIDELYCADGIHPNTAGQKRITEALCRFVGDYRNMPLPAGV